MGRLTFIKAWTAGGRGGLSAGQADTKLRWRRNSRKSLPTWTRYGVSSIARAEPRCNIGRAKPRPGKRFGNLHRHPANTEVSRAKCRLNPKARQEAPRPRSDGSLKSGGRTKLNVR